MLKDNMGTTIELDALDRRLLYELDHNARQSFSELARTVKQGRDRIEYRVKRLIELGIIRGTTVVVDLYKLGFSIFKTYLKIQNNKKEVDRFLKALRAHKRVFWIAICDGNCDLTISIAAKSPFEFYQIQSEIFSEHSSLIIDFYVTTLAGVWAYRKKYLYKPGTRYFFFGGEPGAAQLDPLNYKLLNLLSENARLSINELADKTSTTPATVKSRLEKLERDKIVLGYRLEIDRRRMGYAFWKAQLVLQSHRLTDLEALKNHCNTHPNITYLVQQIGTYKIELELEVASYEQYFKIIEELRERFSHLIRNVEMMLIKDEIYKWLPISQVVGAEAR
jgi:DNA-binding Lrp family transcriptional regulator